MAGKIMITGASGKCGTALLKMPGELVLFDRKALPEHKNMSNVFTGNLDNLTLLAKAMKDCKAIVHLAASPDVNSSWDDVLKNNIIGTQNLLVLAQLAGVERVIFASTNHVVGIYEEQNKQSIYEPGHGIMLTKEVEPRPDSLYGVSKLFGENVGRYVAEKEKGPKFYVLRIGTVLKKEDEYLYGAADEDVRNGKYKKGDPEYIKSGKRLQATWLSREDLLQLVQLCLDYQGPPFDIFYGISDNPTRWMDIEYAKKQLSYLPAHSGDALPLERVTA